MMAARGALDAAGVEASDVDGVFGEQCGDVAYRLGLGASATTAISSVGIPAVIEAVQAIASGLCTTALVVSGNAGSYQDRSATAPWTRPTNEWVAPFGLYTAVEFALVAQRHMYQFGTTREQLAMVAATIRNHGHVNPEAVYFGRGPFAPETVLASRMVADPFHLLDCAMTSEGGCALVLTTAERARSLRCVAIGVLGAGFDRIAGSYQIPPSWDLTDARGSSEPAGLIGRRAARMAFRLAGLTPDDVDVAELYDPFSFEIIRQLEAFGFCDVGEGGAFVEDGGIGPGGRLPVTTDGGLMSFSHAGRPQLLQRVARGVHQLQGKARTNQVPDAEVAICSNGGSGALYSDVIILGRQS